MLTDEEVASYVELGYESAAVEFKSGGSVNDGQFVALVARAAMALANQPDGGFVFIGVREGDASGPDSGLSEELLQEWLAYDVVVDKLNAYADPPLSIHVAQRSLPGEGRPIVIVEVQEFDQVPVLCKKEYQGKLQRGVLYTRSMAKPESSARNTQNEMRAVLDLATRKQVAMFLNTARQVGLDTRAGSLNEDPFESQAQDFLRRPVAAHISTGPHLVGRIRPPDFVVDRIDISGLEPAVVNSQARLRGWPLPGVIQSLDRGSDWVGEFNEERRHQEAWMLRQSGFFIDVRPIDQRYPADDDAFGISHEDDMYLPVWVPTYFFTEFLMFASRLRDRVDPDNPTLVTLGIANIDGWVLAVNNPRRSGFHNRYAYADPSWSTEVALEPGATPEVVFATARTAARELFVRFGWAGVSDEALKALQEEARV